MRNLLCILTLFISIHTNASDLDNYLFPQPKQVILKKGKLKVKQGVLLLYRPELIKPTLLLLNHIIKSGIDATISPLNTPNQIICYNRCILGNEQGYNLVITENNITISASSDVGFFYALLTLNQIGRFAKQNGYWPCLEISDEPDFERRGIMLDISRDKVPTMSTLMALVDQFSSWKINELQLYTEHTFAYSNHEVVWKDASPMTVSDIQKLDLYCKENYIDLVPNQNSFGHMHRWLKHPEYSHLAELEQPGMTIWGMRSKNTLSPVEEGSMELMRELYSELLPVFSSNYFNIGCDETVELGVGKSKQLCQQLGKGKVYLNYLLQLKGEVDKYDKKVQFWGDIILNHPELIDSLPKDMIALIWGYESNHPFNKQCQKFNAAGLDYYVCPGTSTWKTLIGRNKNSFENIRNAATNGKINGAKGFLLTDWGDYGHWQPLTVSYPAYIYGAAISWNISENQSMDIADYTSWFAFNDTTGISGNVTVNLGNAYLLTGANTDNSNIFHQLLQRNQYSIKTDRWLKNTTIQKLKETQNYIHTQLEQLEAADISSYDADIINEELRLATGLAMHSCKLGIAKLQTKEGFFSDIPKSDQYDLYSEFDQLIQQHKKVWLLRNRPGGLDDSSEKMKSILRNYR